MPRNDQRDNLTGKTWSVTASLITDSAKSDDVPIAPTTPAVLTTLRMGYNSTTQDFPRNLTAEQEQRDSRAFSIEDEQIVKTSRFEKGKR